MKGKETRLGSDTLKSIKSRSSPGVTRKKSKMKGVEMSDPKDAFVYLSVHKFLGLYERVN